MGEPERKSRWTRRRFLKLALAGGVAAASGGYVWRSNTLIVSHERYAAKGWAGAPRKIAAFSDLHAPGYGSTGHLCRVLSDLEPDILVMIGDSVEREGGEKALEAFADVKAPGGKFAVLGNWDYWSDVPRERLRRSLAAGGFTLLVNETHETDGMIVAGLDDFLAGVPRPALLEAGKKGGKPLVALSHCPAIFETVVEKTGAPFLMLSGHTHGGQIAPAGFAPYLPRGSGPFVRGWYRRGESSLYVTRGVGNTILPLRVGARPEVLSLTIVPA